MKAMRLKSVVTCLAVKSDGTPLPFVGLEDIGSGTGSLLADDLPMKAATDSVLYQAGDVLFSKLRPYLAKSFMPEKPGSATGELLVLRPHANIENRFLLYSTLSSPWLEWADTTSYGTKMPRTSWDAMSEYRLGIPPLDEQRRIADFLDAETARIDQLVSFIFDSSNLLQAKRRALLMTVFPDVEIVRVRLGYFLCLVTSGPRGWGDFVGSKGMPFFRSANLRRDSIQPSLDDLALVDAPPSAAAEAARSRVYVGDVLIGITGANTGWVSLADQRIANANVSQHVCLVRPGNKVEGRWLAYALSAPQVQELLLGSQYGGTKTQLSLGDIRDLVVPLPPVAAQQRIVAEITEGLAAITTERAIRDRQLRLLAERRQALITAAVTGQIDVTTAGQGATG